MFLTEDEEFLLMNKFTFIINCSAEISNHFEHYGFRYLKFKLVRDKPHKLWDQQLKKLTKIQQFINICSQQSLCCLIFSSQGNNRSLVMLTAYLMAQYRWTITKTLEYIRSKNIFIGLSEHYIGQLEILQKILSMQTQKPSLSNDWRGPYINEEQEIICRTFLNSQDIPVSIQQYRQKKQKRISWKDRMEKEKKRESSKKLKGEGELKKEKSQNKQNKKIKIEETALRNKMKALSSTRIERVRSGQKDEELDSQILSILKQNLREKMMNSEYKVTINNFIKPNIKIVGDRINRSQSQKQTKLQRKNRNSMQKEQSKLKNKVQQNRQVEDKALEFAQMKLEQNRKTQLKNRRSENTLIKKKSGGIRSKNKTK